jgi:hypothetical protein
MERRAPRNRFTGGMLFTVLALVNYALPHTSLAGMVLLGSGA